MLSLSLSLCLSCDWDTVDSFLGIPNITAHEWEKLIAVCENLGSSNVPTVILGSFCLVLIVGVDLTKALVAKHTSYKWAVLFPTPLLIVVFSILITYFAGLYEDNVAILGHIVGGFPMPTIPMIYNMTMLRQLVRTHHSNSTWQLTLTLSLPVHSCGSDSHRWIRRVTLDRQGTPVIQVPAPIIGDTHRSTRRSRWRTEIRWQAWLPDLGQSRARGSRLGEPLRSTSGADRHERPPSCPSSNSLISCSAPYGMWQAIFQAYPTNGSLPRSVVSDLAGATTQLAGLVSSMLVLICILFLTGLFYYLPKTAIAAIVIVAAARLIEFDFAYQYRIGAYKEMLLSVISFLATFFLGPELGIVVAMGMSFFLVMKHTTRPSIDILGTTKDGRWRPLHTAPDELQTLPVRKQRHLVLPQHFRTLTLPPRSWFDHGSTSTGHSGCTNRRELVLWQRRTARERHPAH